MNSSYHGVTAVCSSKVNNITFAIVTADRDFIEADFECLGGMLMFLNTFDECQNDIYPPTPRPVSLLVSPFHTVSLLSFSVLALYFVPRHLKPMKPGLFIRMDH